jgi:hypothetical protein
MLSRASTLTVRRRAMTIVLGHAVVPTRDDVA